MGFWLREISLNDLSGRALALPGATAVVLKGARLTDPSVRLLGGPAGWHAQQVGGAEPLFSALINGEPMPIEPDRYGPLEVGDVIELPDRLAAVIDGPERLSREHEAAIEARPGDEGPVLVWADWLTEQGDPLGARLVAAHRGAKVGPSWEGLTRLAGRGGLEASVRFGLIDAVRVVALPPSEGLPFVASLAQLRHLRAARFLRSLSVEVAALTRPLAGRGLHVDPWAELAQLLVDLRFPPTLEHVALGARDESLMTADARVRSAVMGLPEGTAAALFARLRAAYPRLAGDPAALFG